MYSTNIKLLLLVLICTIPFYLMSESSNLSGQLTKASYKDLVLSKDVLALNSSTTNESVFEGLLPSEISSGNHANNQSRPYLNYILWFLGGFILAGSIQVFCTKALFLDLDFSSQNNFISEVIDDLK